MNRRNRLPIGAFRNKFFVLLLIAGIAMLAAPMATVQATKPELRSVEIESEGTHTGHSLYSYSRQHLYQDWEDNTNPDEAARDARRADLVAGQRGEILTAPGYSNPPMGQEIKVFGNGDEIVLKLTFHIDVKVVHDGTSNLPSLRLVFDGEALRPPPDGTDRDAVYDSARTAADTDLKVVYFTYTVQDNDNLFGDGINIDGKVRDGRPSYKDDANNFIIDNATTIPADVSTTADTDKWKTPSGDAYIYSKQLNRDFYVGRQNMNYKEPTTHPYIHTGLNYQVDAKRASVRIPGLIKDGTHDVQTGYRTAYVNFATTDPDAAVTEPDTQTVSFDVEFLFYNYGIGGDDDGVIADSTRGFEATDITFTVDDTAVTLGTTAPADWQVSDPILIGLDHRDPGFFATEKEDNGLVKHSSAFKVYRATITPPAVFEGDVEITVPEDATMDIAGNLSYASNTLTVPVDTASIAVNIPDAALRAKIKEELDIAAGTAVTRGDMLGLTDLDLSDSDVSDLTGLKYATNLEELNLEGTPVSDVSPLSTLTTLKELDLSDTPVEDISSLSTLTNLEELDISGTTQVSDIPEELSGLTSLTIFLPDAKADYFTLSALAAGKFEVLTQEGSSATTHGISSAVAPVEALTRNLSEFFRNGGTIELIAPKLTTGGAAKGDVVISEVLWGEDASQTPSSAGQWIELYAVKAVADTAVAKSWSLYFTTGKLEIRPEVTIGETPYLVIDSISNLGLGYWEVPGGGGRTVATDKAASASLVSMYRSIDFEKDPDEVKDGNRSDNWQASSAPSINLGGQRIGTPGSTPSQRIAAGDRTSFEGRKIVINEVGNHTDDSLDWVELRNDTTDAVNIKEWELTLVTGTPDKVPFDGKETVLVTLPDKSIAGGGVLLVANSNPEGNLLAGGDDLGVADADEVKHGAKHQYIVVSGLNLPADGKFLLLLRNKKEQKNKPIHIEDAAGAVFVPFVGTHDSQNYNTEVWPLQATPDPDKDIFKDIDEAFKEGSVYQRDNENNFAENAWSKRGFTGIGWDRDTPNADAYGGTPGYQNGVVKDKSAAGQVSISEIMFDTDNRLPQWIELHNSSLTEAVNLNDWTLRIQQDATTDTAVRPDVTLKFVGGKIIPPNQTLLIVTDTGRTSGHFPDARVINLRRESAYRDKLDLERRSPVLATTAFKLTLYGKEASGVKPVVDTVGNYVGRGEEPAWELPMLEDGRSSIIRRYGSASRATGAVAEDGTTEAGWVLAANTSLNEAQRDTFYGNAEDEGTPGYRGGGPLPVALSAFTAKRVEGAIVISWATESELNNAGFNLLRSDARNGTFTKINSELIAGAGTTGERNDYSWTDTSAKPNVVYYYRIEDVSNAGVQQTLQTTRLKGHLSADGKLTERWATLKSEE